MVDSAPPFMPPDRARQRGLALAVKRAIDIAVAGSALVAAAPAMAAVAVAIRVRMGAPVLFRQPRPGQGERIFTALKFRTMRDATDARGQPLPDGQRLTALGRFLRRSSLDELPQLFNVLRGEMSLVGPRPIVLGEVERYGRYIEKYYAVRPGITALWQIGGRNNVSYRRRVALDVTYTRNRSTLLNVRILIWTIPSVLMARGSY